MTSDRQLSGGRLRPEDVQRVRFSPTKLRVGYDQNEVDDFLDRVEHELRSRSQGSSSFRRLSESEVRAQRFTASRFREGYAQNQVDAFMERIADELRSE